jgi:hypothetical protein
VDREEQAGGQGEELSSQSTGLFFTPRADASREIATNKLVDKGIARKFGSIRQ